MPTSSAAKYAFLMMMMEDIMVIYRAETTLLIHRYMTARSGSTKRRILDHARRFSLLKKIPDQLKHLDRLVKLSNVDCIANLRMDVNTFGRLCQILSQRGGLITGNSLPVEEQVAIFLGVLAHHNKNRVVKFRFRRSGATVSYYMQKVLCAILSLHDELLKKPTPVTADCTDNRWRWFEGCLGALDGIHIDVLVSNEDKPRYRTRKGHIATNTLAVCDRQMQFVYLLPGWEGSAGDSRVLKDAVSAEKGFKVPQGCYYLCDNGYANSNGFLTPYRGVRYHLKEWGPGTDTPQNPKELFNMRHTKARNIIERAFAVLKMRWGILRSASYYPIRTQIRLIMACFLLHNFIRGEMRTDPIEVELDGHPTAPTTEEEHVAREYIDYVEPSPEWTQM
ncbi:protein ANTAGONIST OF LIKE HETEROCHROMATIN PROTEIN 1-like [Salvia splendens]|uniref:protein ANTAGONIST OF LIKE HETEROCHROMATIN PROTEIN 1-like n=1 Tax=Salvia splendens TaxID=180675 RepID=UPI001C269467|nr:protein ANTAGONIST OF LIKE HETEROCHROMATIN PROTEIN 1-like [Salvia splendens]